MTEKVLEYEMLSYFLDETYGDQVPPYYSMKKEAWDILNAKQMAINRIRKELKESPPWESAVDTLEKLQNEAAVDLGCSMSMGKRNKKTIGYYNVIYYTISDVLNYLYMLQAEDEQ